MSLRTWVRDKLNGWLGGWSPWSRYSSSSDTYAGKAVTADGAMNLSAWWRCVKLHSEVTGTMPLKFYQRGEDDDRKQIKDHPVAKLIAIDPNIDQTSQEFWGGHAAALCMYGNAYAEKQFSGDRLVALQPLPVDMYPYRNTDDELYYRFSGRPKADDLPAEKVFHTRGFGFGGDRGLSPLEYARQTLSIAIATEQTTGKTFSKGLRIGGFFTGQGMKPAQRDDFTKTYIDPITGNDAENHYGILPPGFDFKPMNIHPKDAEMLLSRKFNVEDICRFMGVPPILVGHASDGQTMWGSGVEHIMLAWLMLGLDAFLSTIEKSINKRLLTPGERTKYYAEFDRKGLLRADSTGRAEMYSKLFQLGGLTANQICDKENFPRFEDGNTRFVNSTFIPYAAAGKKWSSNDGGAAPALAPGDAP